MLVTSISLTAADEQFPQFYECNFAGFLGSWGIANKIIIYIQEIVLCSSKLVSECVLYQTITSSFYD